MRGGLFGQGLLLTQGESLAAFAVRRVPRVAKITTGPLTGFLDSWRASHACCPTPPTRPDDMGRSVRKILTLPT
jgi:hypothetical protein